MKCIKSDIDIAFLTISFKCDMLDYAIESCAGYEKSNGGVLRYHNEGDQPKLCKHRWVNDYGPQMNNCDNYDYIQKQLDIHKKWSKGK